MSEDPHIGSNRGTPDRLGGEHPAVSRPGPHAPIPLSREPYWFDRLQSTMDIDEVLAAARIVCRRRNPRDDSAWPDIENRLRLARAMLLDGLNEQPHSQVAIEYLNQIHRFLGPA